MNRSERRQLDRDVKKSILIVREHLKFLNAAGNPKYELKIVSPLKYKIKKILRLA